MATALEDVTFLEFKGSSKQNHYCDEISDLLVIFFLQMYTILVLDSSKAENIMPQTPYVLHSEKQQQNPNWISKMKLHLP